MNKPLWFVSYCGHDGKWIGAAVIRGSHEEARRSGKEFGISECAERLMLVVPPDAVVSEKWIGKPLNKKQIREMTGSNLLHVKSEEGKIVSVDPE